MKKLFFLITILFSTILFSQEVDIINTGEKVGLENWRIVNDDVMGGISKSNLYLNSNGNLIFKYKFDFEIPPMTSSFTILQFYKPTFSPVLIISTS